MRVYICVSVCVSVCVCVFRGHATRGRNKTSVHMQGKDEKAAQSVQPFPHAHKQMRTSRGRCTFSRKERRWPEVALFFSTSAAFESLRPNFFSLSMTEAIFQNKR